MDEGHLTFRGHQVWFRVVGEGRGKPPLLLIHGGPGSSSDLLTPLAGLATGRQVVFYDQLGAGRSTRTHDPALWTIDTFVDEIQAVRDHLGLDDVHVLGHSWGGMLALEYALRRPAGLRSLVLASALVSAPLFAAEATRLVSQLPTPWRRVLEAPEPETSPAPSPALAEPPPERAEVDRRARLMRRLVPVVGATPLAHVAAVLGRIPVLRGPAATLVELQYARRHVFRSRETLPMDVARMALTTNREVYRHLWGSHEWSVTGTLKDWDVRDRLPEITVPALVTGGRYDEVTPAQVEALADGLPESELVMFEDSSHCAMWEERELFLAVVAEFLERQDRR